MKVENKANSSEHVFSHVSYAESESKTDTSCQQ